tara:strand:- start:45 stop:2609 length:2565 start_codon:yes stop_codon:yes gene_type:complete
MVWTKNRDSSLFSHRIFDTERGIRKMLASNNNAAESSNSQTLTAYNSNGFSLGTDSMVNSNNDETASWTFRKRKGFFDIQTWSGNSTAGRQISHDLESVPGCIMVKRLDSGSSNWIVYHRSIGNNVGGAGKGPEQQALWLNSTSGQDESVEYWNNTPPTKDNFTLGIHPTVNQTGGDYVAYIFAHNQSSTTGQITSNVKSPNGMFAAETNPPTMSTGPFNVANTAVTFSGTTNFPLTAISSPQFCLANNTYTIECWFKAGSTAWSQSWSMLFSQWDDPKGIYFGLRANGYAGLYNTTGVNFANFNLEWTQNTWHHVAITRESTGGSQSHIWLDGQKKASWTDNTNVTRNESHLAIGYQAGSNSENFAGQISNLRYTVGQALYTSNFTPATSNLTTTSQGASEKNVVFLGLNGDANSDFEEAHKFGENEDQSLIKCGAYDGASDINVAIGFEPQLLFIKAYTTNSNSNCDWLMIDNMRGFTANGQHEKPLRANTANNEGSYDNLHPTVTSKSFSEGGILGFRGTGGFDNSSNSGNGPYIYIAIRRSDGYVGKPPEAGTDVFNVTLGNGSSTIPSLPSAFPVDYCLYKDLGNANWGSTSRLTGEAYTQTNTTAGEAQAGEHQWDSHVGCHAATWLNSGDIGYLWKRHAGFDVVTYDGNGTAGRKIPHSLSKPAEMMWVRKRSGTEDWVVYHEGMNGGTNPAEYYMSLNLSNDQGQSGIYFNNTAPTSSTFTVGSSNRVNNSSGTYMAMLFASVEGISKVGSYVGQNTSLTLNFGFNPRFLFIKRYSGGGNVWMVFDTVRGIGAGNPPFLHFDQSASSTADRDWIDPTPNGIIVNSNNGGYHEVNASGSSYIYYAHA